MEFIRYICEILGIKEPAISFDTSMFPTKTTFAMADIKNRVLHLRDEASKIIQDVKGDVDLTLCLSISHELRHIWQADTDFDYWFHDYSSDRSDIDAYNTQRAEIDANAFGDMVCIALFGVETIFGDLSLEVCNKIKDRRAELEAVYTEEQ